MCMLCAQQIDTLGGCSMTSESILLLNGHVKMTLKAHKWPDAMQIIADLALMQLL